MVTISFESETWASKPKDPAPAFRPQNRGPDGSILNFGYQFVKPGKGPTFVRVWWTLELRTKVRSPAVARWVLAQFGNASVSLLNDSVDYRRNEGGLARLIEEKSKDLPKGTRSDPSDDEEGGQGVAAPLEPKPPGLSGAEKPSPPDERE